MPTFVSLLRTSIFRLNFSEGAAGRHGGSPCRPRRAGGPCVLKSVYKVMHLWQEIYDKGRSYIDKSKLQVIAR